MIEKFHMPKWARLPVALMVAHLPLIPPVIGFLVLRGKTMDSDLHGFEFLCAKLAPLWNLVFLVFYLPALGITKLIVGEPHSWTPFVIGAILQSTIIGIGLWVLWKKRSTADLAYMAGSKTRHHTLGH